MPGLPAPQYIQLVRITTNEAFVTRRFGVRKLLILTALCSLGSLSLLCGQTPAVKSDAKPEAVAKIEPLIEQLGDPDYRKRDQAQQQIQSHGLAALPALRKAVAHSDAEVRRRVVDLIPLIETAAVLAPRRINLQVKNKSLREIFEEITRQTGLKVMCWDNNANQNYSYDFRNVTFWEATERICRDSGLVIQVGYGDDSVRLQQQNGYVPYVQQHGAFRFAANNIQQLRNLDLNVISRDSVQPRRSDSLTLTFTLFVEPRLSILGIGDPKLSAAYDNEKNSLLPPQNAPEQFENQMLMGGRRWSSGRYGNRSSSYSVSVNLNRVSEKATSIKSLRGSVPVNLLVDQKPVVVTDKIMTAKGKKMKIDSNTINIGEATKLPTGQYQLKLGISEENKDDNDYSWMNTMYQRLRLEDDKGNVFQSYGTSWGNSSPNHVDLTMTFGPPPNAKSDGPTKLIFTSWTTLLHQLHFEFKDLPLP